MKRERSTFQPATGIGRRLSIAASTALVAVSMLASFQPGTANAATGNELLIEQLSPDDVNKGTMACDTLENAVSRAVSAHKTQSPEIVSAAIVRAPNFECQKRLVTVAIQSLGDRKLVRQYAPQIAEAAVRSTPDCTVATMGKDDVAFDKDGKAGPYVRSFDKDGKGGPYLSSFDKDGKAGPPLDICACAEALTATAIAAIGGDPNVAAEAFNSSSEPRLYTTTGQSYADGETVMAIVQSVLSAVPASCAGSILESAPATAMDPPSVPPPFVFQAPPTGGIVPEVTPVN
ncbi:MAG TPA: hypothetical protein VIT21_12300 [Chthoniobacterales bacterium]